MYLGSLRALNEDGTDKMTEFLETLTNSEKRVSAYLRGEKPTVPFSVTSDTPLEELNLNWSEKDLPEKIRTKHVHRLHPYLGKFIPQLVEIFLRKFFNKGETVLDPFCGSGTTLVQANELGISSVGYDTSAFNVLLSKVKTDQYDIRRMKKEVLDILEKVRHYSKPETRQKSFWDFQYFHQGTETQPNEDYLTNWFGPQALLELITYRNLIYSEDYQYKDLLKVILCRSARSARLTTHFDLDFPKKPVKEPYWCYKHSRMCSPTIDAYKFLRRYSLDSIKRITVFSKLRTDSAVRIYHGDSRSEVLPEVDGVITSPPYVGLIDYHGQHEYAFRLLGLQDNKEAEIGISTKGTGKIAINNYITDMVEVFKQVKASVRKGGIIIVVANDKANLYERIALMSGFALKNIIQRHVNRRTGRRSNDYFESIFIYQKDI